MLQKRSVFVLLGESLGAVRGSELWRRKDELLDSVPGVGPVLRAALLAWLPELGTLNRKEAAALIRVAPFNHGSENVLPRELFCPARASGLKLVASDDRGIRGPAIGDVL
jgi:transposase